MKYTILTGALALLFFAAAPAAIAQTPALLNYQGRVQTGTPPLDFTGTGEFKFALMEGTTTTRLWNNNGPTTADPFSDVSLPVTNGLYSVLLGDTSIANMTAIPPSAFSRPDVRLRVWFNGRQLSPDQRLAPNGYLPTHIPGPIAIGNTAAPGFPITVKVNGTNDLMGFRNSTDETKWHVKLIATSNVLNFVESGVAENRLVLAPGGNIGIGTSSPTQAKLVVDGFVNSRPSVNQMAQITPTASSHLQTSYVTNNSIYASGNIWTNGWLLASSDERIKEIKGQSDNLADLHALRGIQITDYFYKDIPAKGAVPQKKVIAQQVEKVFPQAVSKQTDVVPDIFQTGDFKDGWVALKTDLKKGERVRLSDDKTTNVFEVLEVAEGKFRSAFKPEGDKVFVYGREVNDFRTVDYDAISMLNVSATQELARQLEAEKATTAALKERLARLEAKDADRDAKLAALMKMMEDRSGEAEAATVSTVTTQP